jgi:peroxin-6
MLSQSLQYVVEDPVLDCSDYCIKDIVGQTCGFLPRDIQAFIADAGANFILRINDTVGTINFTECAESISGENFHKQLSKDDLEQCAKCEMGGRWWAGGCKKKINIRYCAVSTHA